MPLVKLSLLILFVPFFISVLCFFFDGSLSNVIALPTIAIAIVVALNGHSEKITVTKIEAKRLRATTFAIARLEER